MDPYLVTKIICSYALKENQKSDIYYEISNKILSKKNENENEKKN
jgi:hypothetical protein